MKNKQTSVQQTVKNLKWIGANYPRIAPVQTVGVIEDVLTAAMMIEQLESSLKDMVEQFTGADQENDLVMVEAKGLLENLNAE